MKPSLKLQTARFLLLASVGSASQLFWVSRCHDILYWSSLSQPLYIDPSLNSLKLSIYIVPSVSCGTLANTLGLWHLLSCLPRDTAQRRNEEELKFVASDFLLCCCCLFCCCYCFCSMLYLRSMTKSPTSSLVQKLNKILCLLFILLFLFLFLFSVLFPLFLLLLCLILSLLLIFELGYFPVFHPRITDQTQIVQENKVISWALGELG